MANNDKQIIDYLAKYGHVSTDLYERIRDIFNDYKYNEKKLDSIRIAIRRFNRLKWRRFNVVIYLVPKATPRPRLNFGTNTFYVKGASFNSKLFKDFMIDNNIKIKVDTPCKIYCDAYLPTPSNMTMEQRILAELRMIYPISKPDFDNIVKTYSDMIQGSLLEDDSFVVDGRVRKFYSAKPRIELCVEYLEEYDHEYNEKKVKKRKGD